MSERRKLVNVICSAEQSEAVFLAVLPWTDMRQFALLCKNNPEHTKKYAPGLLADEEFEKAWEQVKPDFSSANLPE